MKIRAIAASDWPEVLDIETRSHEYPWGRDAFLKFSRKVKNTVLVFEQDCEVIGYLGYEKLTRRFQIHNLAVHPKYRRCQTATRLMEFCKARAEREKIKTLDVEVRERNVPMQLFLQSQGFLYVDTLGEYEGEDEDCYQFQWKAH